MAASLVMPCSRNEGICGKRARESGSVREFGVFQDVTNVADNRQSDRLGFGKPVPVQKVSPWIPPITDTEEVSFCTIKTKLRGQDDDAVCAPLGREVNFQSIVEAVGELYRTGRGSSLYVSGLPGTGKSLTVRRAVQAVCGQQRDGKSSHLVWLNCMSVSNGGEVYQQVVSCCGGPVSSGSVTFDQLVAFLKELSQREMKQATGKKSSRKASQPTPSKVVIVLDEMDSLLSKSLPEVYNMFSLPHLPGVQTTVIGIANSIDLTERALPNLKTRGYSPKLLCFPAYSTSQVVTILKAKIAELTGSHKLFEDVAIERCARSVSSSTGDFRQAIRACCVALDCLGARIDATCLKVVEGVYNHTVGLRDMAEALAQLAGAKLSESSSAATTAIRALPNQQQLLLYSVAVLCKPSPTVASLPSGLGSAPPSIFSTPVKRQKNLKGLKVPSTPSTPVTKTFTSCATLESIFEQYVKVCRQAGIKALAKRDVEDMCDLLCQMSLVEVTQGVNSASRRHVTTRIPLGVVGLKVNSHDVSLALSANPLLRTLTAQLK